MGSWWIERWGVQRRFNEGCISHPLENEEPDSAISPWLEDATDSFGAPSNQTWPGKSPNYMGVAGKIIERSWTKWGNFQPSIGSILVELPLDASLKWTCLWPPPLLALSLGAEHLAKNFWSPTRLQGHGSELIFYIQIWKIIIQIGSSFHPKHSRNIMGYRVLVTVFDQRVDPEFPWISCTSQHEMAMSQAFRNPKFLVSGGELSMVLGNPLAKEKWASCCHFDWLMLVNVGEKVPKINKQLPDSFFSKKNYQTTISSVVFLGNRLRCQLASSLQGWPWVQTRSASGASRVGHCWWDNPNGIWVCLKIVYP